jgi:hypothetical protein
MSEAGPPERGYSNKAGQAFPDRTALQDLHFMQALDELVARWRKNPDPESTLALCAHLGTSSEAELILEVASLAEAWHKDNHMVMLSVGRMYLDSGLLAEAQTALMQAGRLAPDDVEAYRHLGEVLLRRGDAIRSEKTLARAIQLGDDNADTHLWHERAVLYVALQKRQGLRAVADEVARTAPHQPSIPAPALSPFDRVERVNALAANRTARRSHPPLAGTRSAGRRRSSVAPPGRRRGSTPPPASAPPGRKSSPRDSDPFQGTFSDAPTTKARVEVRDAQSKAIEPRAATAPRSSPDASRAAPPRAEPDPTPDVILSMLAQVGLYEQESTVVPTWEQAPRPAPRRLWITGSALLLAASLGLGGYRYALGVQNERLARAQELGMRLSNALDSGSRAQLRGTDADFQVLFELDSRGREPALLWLENRVLYALLTEEPVSGIESAMQRARDVGVEEPRLIFGRLASALAAGDLPGAGLIIARWDARTRDDALYQLLAGVVFERAGNPEALDRYVAATHLSPELKLAHALAARLALIQLGPAAARSTLEVARSRLGPGLASDVLGGLAWATAPFNDTPGPALPPPEALADLSPLMQDTASAVVAVKAQREGRLEESAAAFQRALGPATTPAMAAWIGYQALDSGDVVIARRAALKAMQLSAQHQSSQTLAARIALAEGRLDAARAAVRGVDPSSRDALLIEAVNAYENLQGPEAARLVGALPADPALASTLEALQGIDRVIAGAARPKDERLTQLSGAHKLWGSIVAVDLALDSGRLPAAEAIVKARAWDSQVPAYAVRLMRLRRYQGRGAAALELAPALSDPRGATPRAVAELVLAFVEEGRAAAATTALGDMNAAAGALGPWLTAIVECANGRQASAGKIIAPLALPDRARPLLEQLVALRALAATNDRRGRAYYARLEARFKAQPDLVVAGKQLGLIK